MVNSKRSHHERIKYKCLPCGGSQICEHNRIRWYCKAECGAKGICEHHRQKEYCKECRGSQICEHDRFRKQCKDCGGSQICPHIKNRDRFVKNVVDLKYVNLTTKLSRVVLNVRVGGE